MAETYCPKPEDVVYWDGKPVGHILSVTQTEDGITANVSLSLDELPFLKQDVKLSIYGG